MNELKKLRINAGLSQVMVADELGYGSAQFVSNWERGLSIPPKDAIKTLAKVYCVSRVQIAVIMMNHDILKVKKSYERFMR